MHLNMKKAGIMLPIALVAAVKNDGPFLLEWVTYHRLIGFERIVIFAENGADSATPLLNALAAAGQITLIDNQRVNDNAPSDHRMRAYACAFDVVQDCEWVLALDTDEFLNVSVAQGTVQDLIAVANGADLISLTWRVFGQNDHWVFEDDPVLPRFLSAAPRGAPRAVQHKGIKTLFRPHVGVEKMMPHRPRLTPALQDDKIPLTWVDGNGADISGILRSSGWSLPEGRPAYGIGQINKYPIRSSEAYVLTNLSDPSWHLATPALELSDFAQLDTTEERDLSILRWAPGLKARLAQLRENPAIAKGHAETVEAYRKAILEMRATAPATWLPLLDPEVGKPVAPHRAAVKRTAAQPPTAKKSAPAPGPVPDPIPEADVDHAPRWLADLRRSEHRRGFYHSDTHFAAQYTDRQSDALVVSFDNLSNVGDTSLSRESWGYSFYRSEGWSHLGVMAFERNWFRDEALFDYMEDLAARGFFAGYKHVMFTGTSMGAYAATAFAKLRPGCTVTAFSPQSTLDTKIVPWEKRFGSGRKQDWSGRYGDATTCIDQAEAIYMIYDPYFEPDRLHAERYQGPNVHYLKTWYASHKTALFMNRADILKPVVREALTGALTSHKFYQMSRERRKLPWYLNGLYDHLRDAGHTDLAQNLATHLIDTGRSNIGRTMLKKLSP